MMDEADARVDEARRNGASSYLFPEGEDVHMDYENPDGSSGGYNTHVRDGDYTSKEWLADRRAAAHADGLRAEAARRHPETRSREAWRDPVTGRVRPLEIEDLPLVGGASDPPGRERGGPEGSRRGSEGRPRGAGWPDDADATFDYAMDTIGDTPGTRGRTYRGGEYAGGGGVPTEEPPAWGRRAGSGEAAARRGGGHGPGGRGEPGDPRGGHGPAGGHEGGHEAGGGHGHERHGHGADILPGEGPYAEPTLTTYDPASGEVITNPRYKEVDLRFIETQLNELRAPHETGGVSIGGELITEQQVALVDKFCEKYGVDDWKDIKAAVYADTRLGDRPRRPDMPKRGIKRMPPWAVFTELPRCIWEDHTPLKPLDRSKNIAFGLFSTDVDDVYMLSVVEVSPRRNRKTGENQISGLVAAYAVRADGREQALKAARAYSKRQKYLTKGIIHDPGHTFDTHAKIHEGDNALLAAGISNEAGPTVLPGEIEKRPDGTIIYDRSKVWAGVDDDELTRADDSGATAEELGDLPGYGGMGPKRGVAQRGDRVQPRGGALGLGPSGRKGRPRPEGGAGPARGAGPAAGDSGGAGGPRGPRGPRPMPAGGASDVAAESPMRVPSTAFGLSGESGTAGSVWRLVPPGEATAGPARPRLAVRPAAEAPAPTVGSEAPRRPAPVRAPDRPAPVRAPAESPSVPPPGVPAESTSVAPVAPVAPRPVESARPRPEPEVRPRPASSPPEADWPTAAGSQAVRPQEGGARQETRRGGFQSYAARPGGEYRPIRRPTDRDGDDDSIAHTRIDTGTAGGGGQLSRQEGSRVDAQTRAVQPETAAAEQDYSALRTAEQFVAAADAILSRGDVSRPAAQTELDRLMQAAQEQKLLFPINKEGQVEHLQPQQYLMYRLTKRPRKGGERS
jgi:hypothetical protein